MTADYLLQAVTQAVYVLIFIVTAGEAVRRPSRANTNIAALFGAVALVVAIGWFTASLQLPPNQAVTALNVTLVMLLPYLLLRLVDDFTRVSPWLMRGAELSLVLVATGFFLTPAPLPVWLTLLFVTYFVGLQVYTAVMFVTAARRSSGVTRRRMQAVAIGSLCLGLAIAMVGFRAGLPVLEPWWTALLRLFSLASGLSYFLGFAPPRWLRRAWQEPELRAFLARAARLPRLPDTPSIVRELEQGAASSVGSPWASVGLWQEAAGLLRFTNVSTGEPWDLPSGQMIGGRAFAEQRAIFSADARRDDPAHAAVYEEYGAVAVLAAPITAGERRLGVLVVFAPRAPIFATDDLVLVQLLADQAAVILESRALIDEAARVRAREEVTRLKDDFLSAAAHDLRTPLTTLTAQAQLLERRAQRQPEAPADLDGIRRIIAEAQRLTRLVTELLDASRVEQGQLVGAREPVDLVALAEEVCGRHSTERHPCRVEAASPLLGLYDRLRIQQLFDNLIENAVKYSPAGSSVRVRLWREGDDARLSVADQGIGIPAGDLSRLFERFHRGTNVDDRRFAGMGLGLFICHGIAQQHGGRIWAESPGPGQGTTIHLLLPLGETTRTNADPAAGGHHVGATTVETSNQAPSPAA